jgi:hypothetical protein
VRTRKADVAINYMAKLYAIENQAKDATSEARRQLRQEKSIPILRALRECLDKTLHSALPKGLLGTALAPSVRIDVALIFSVNNLLRGRLMSQPCNDTAPSSRNRLSAR